MTEINNNIPWKVAKPARKYVPRKRSEYPLKFINDAVMFPLSTGCKRLYEENDCTVRALALAAGFTYDVAHEMIADKCGRKPRKGTAFIKLLPHGNVPTIIGNYKVTWHHLKAYYDYTQYRPRRKGTTLKQLLGSGVLPARAVISIANHVFAVIDGVAYDTFHAGARCVVNCYYSFEPVWATGPDIAK